MNYSPDYNMRRRNQECGCGPTAPPYPRKIPCPGEMARTREMPCKTGMARTGEMPCKTGMARTEEMPCKTGMARTGEMPCKPEKKCMDTMDFFPVGMTYTPWQVWRELYNMEEGYPIGTIFKELDYPWEVGRCARCR